MKIGLIMKWGNYYVPTPYRVLTEWAVLMVYFWFLIHVALFNYQSPTGCPIRTVIATHSSVNPFSLYQGWKKAKADDVISNILHGMPSHCNNID